MDFQTLSDNLLSPPVLFFALGFVAVLLRSDLEVPPAISKLLSLYLMLVIGFKGGIAIRTTGVPADVLIVLAAGVVMATIVPFYSFWILRRKLNLFDAAAIAATYGSISAVTFIAATSFLEHLNVPFGGHLVAAMALMESPAIIVGVLLLRLLDPAHRDGKLHIGGLLHEAFLNGPVLLLLGSLVIGVVSSDAGTAAIKPFTNDLFKGVLTLFLLDMGLVAARKVREIKNGGVFLGVFAVVIPLFNAALGIAVARAIGLGAGDALMFTVLCASASYIAVPAAVRVAIPEANPSLYVPMSLAVTFPFNIAIGIPLYWAAITRIWP